MLTQEWKPISEWVGYSISNFGRVFSINGNRDTLLRQETIRGYCYVNLSREGKKKKIRVHRLVLEAFVGPCPEGYVCNHKDGNKANNYIGNLEWVTSSQNVRHAFDNGLAVAPAGEKHYAYGKRRPKVANDKSSASLKLYYQNNPHKGKKITEEHVRSIKTLLAQGYRHQQIAEHYHVSRSLVSMISKGERWAHVSV